MATVDAQQVKGTVFQFQSEGPLRIRNRDMHKIRVYPDEYGLWQWNFDDGKFGFEISNEAFKGMVCQLVECGLYHRATEMVCDADDVEDDDE